MTNVPFKNILVARTETENKVICLRQRFGVDNNRKFYVAVDGIPVTPFYKVKENAMRKFIEYFEV